MDKKFKVKGKISKFSKKLFEKYDIPARQKIKQVLKDFVRDNPDKYGADMMINCSTIKYKFLELQVCAQWTDDKFPHKNVYIWERKGKYENDTLFLTLSRDLEQGYLFDTAKLDKNKPRRFKKYSREYVYDIPWNQVMLIRIEHLTREIIEDF
jgi:hypothetical protein